MLYIADVPQGRHAKVQIMPEMHVHLVNLALQKHKLQVPSMHGAYAWRLMRLFDPFLICCI